MDLSYWETETFFKHADVIIAGSGIVGLNAALCLKQKNPKMKVIVVERGVLPAGASTKNAGFACFGSTTELLEDLNSHSEEEVFSLVEKRLNGLKRLRKNLGDKNIDYKPYGGYEIFDDEPTFQKSVDKLNYLNRKIQKVTRIKNVYKIGDKKISSFGLARVTHLIENSAEGQIDTGKMMLTLLLKVQKLGVIVLNGLYIDHFEDTDTQVKITCNSSLHLYAKHFLICTNGFARRLLPTYAVQPARAQVLVTAPVKNLKLKGSFHYDKGFYYFRNIHNRVLLGGGRNMDFSGEATDEFGLTERIQNRLEWLLQNMILPNSVYKIEQRWSGIMGIGNQKTTIIKPVSKNVFCAVRMGGMGIAIGSLVGEEAAKMVSKTL